MEICLFGTRQTNKQRAKQEKINKSKKKKREKKRPGKLTRNAAVK